MSSRTTIDVPRAPVAAAVALVLAAAAPAALASTWIVDDTCGDVIGAGDLGTRTGTLRFAVKNASSSDTIDLSQTSCSQITLTTGAITIEQQALTLHGAGKNLTIVAGGDGVTPSTDRVFYAKAAGGSVTFDHLTVMRGEVDRSVGPASGGCIYSNGSITLDNVGVYDCTATTTAAVTSRAYGGGVYAHELTVRNGSAISNNTATATQPTIPAQGGGVAVVGDLHMYDTVVAENQANAVAGPNPGFGGGVMVRGNAVIVRSLVAGNHSSLDGGGVDLFANSPTPTAIIANSTISFNSAGRRTGGVLTDLSSTTIANSTVAFNTAVDYAYVGPLRFYSPGISVNYRPTVGAPTLTLQSTIAANNTASGFDNDLSRGAAAAKVVIAGSDNVVRAFGTDVTLPAGQGNLSGVCPLLGPLRDNGGSSFTHALQSGSPGVGVGNNAVPEPATNLPAAFDQRGPGYARVVDALVDVGAYQRQHDDLLDTGFEGCP